MATTVRINSADRDSGTPGDFTVQLSQPLKAGKWRLSQVLLPNTAAPVPSTRTLIVSYSGNDYPITLASDHYDATVFVAALQTKLTATLPATWTVSLDAASQSVSFTQSGGTAASIYAESTLAQSSMASSLGIFSDLTVPAGGVSASPAGCLNLASPLQYSINIDTGGVSAGLEDTKGQRPTFCVPCDVNSFDVISYQARNHEPQHTDITRDLTRLKIFVSDDRGDRLTTALRADWCFVLTRAC